MLQSFAVACKLHVDANNVHCALEAVLLMVNSRHPLNRAEMCSSVSLFV